MPDSPTTAKSTSTPASGEPDFGTRVSGWLGDAKAWFGSLFDNGAGGALDKVGDGVKKMFGSGAGAVGALLGGLGAFFLGSSFAEGWVGKILATIIAIPMAIVGSEFFEKQFGNKPVRTTAPQAHDGESLPPGNTLLLAPQQPLRNIEDPAVAQMMAAAKVSNPSGIQTQPFPSPYDDRTQFMPQGSRPIKTGVRLQ